MKTLYGACASRVQRVLAGTALLVGLVSAAQAAPTKTILVMGDSLSAGYGLAANQGWVPLTADRVRKLHPGWAVVNASISGETTAGGASRIIGVFEVGQG